MDENKATLSSGIDQVVVEISAGQLHSVGYQIFLFDPAGGNKTDVGSGFITTQKGVHTLPKPASQLDLWALKWYVDIGTVTNSGVEEPYQVIIELKQNNADVPGGYIDQPPNQGTFTTTLSYDDYVRLLVP